MEGDVAGHQTHAQEDGERDRHEQVHARAGKGGDSFQWEPDIAEGSGGDCIVVWSTWGIVGKDYEIAARRLSPPVPEGALRQTVVEHPYWRSTTRLALHVYDTTALNGHTYEVIFDSLAGDTASVTVRDIVNDAKMQVHTGVEITWTLWALAHYLDSDDKWFNAAGEPWSIERLVRLQVDLLEGDGGVLWALVLLALIISLLQSRLAR